MFRRSVLLTLIILLVGTYESMAYAVDPSVVEAQRRRIEVVQRVASSVVAIFAGGGAGGGSGVLVTSDGFALTNFHVISSAGSFMKCGLNDGVLYDAVIVGIDPTGDVALIKLLGRDDFPHAQLGDSDEVQVGDWAYAMGNPFLLATDFQPTVTYGIVSGVHRYQYPAGTFLEYADCIQVDSSINPGNSGGPLFNDKGELVGINGRASFEKRGRVNAGAGYAISINQIGYFMDHLRSGRIVDHATLGATVTTSFDGAVVVDQILEQSEAFRRGVRGGDEVVSFAKRPIRSVNQFKNILGIYPKGWMLPFVYRRDGQKYEVVVRLQGLHRDTELMPNRRRPRAPRERPRPEKQPDDKEDRKPGRRRPMPTSAAPPAKPPSEHKHLFVKKDGYANYYYNQLEQTRVLAGIRRMGDFSKFEGPWVIVGKNQQGNQFEFTLADKGLGLVLADRAYYQPLDGSDLLDEPNGTGGLLVAMQHLKLMLKKAESVFTDLYYLGSEPLDGRGTKVDVLVSELTGVQSRWYLSRETGTFIGFDTRLEQGVDECQIRFQGFQTVQGRTFPTTLSIKRALQPWDTFNLERFEIGTPQSAASETQENE